MSDNCPKCWADLQTPLFCESCEEVLEARSSGDGTSPYRILGVAEQFDLDRMALRKRLLLLSRRLHPDVHRTADEETRERAERNTAELNSAFELLENEFRRADWLVKSLGGPDEETERQMPQAFLIEVLEWNETIEDAQASAHGSDERARLEGLEGELQEERRGLMGEVSSMLNPLPERDAPGLAEVRRKLNAVRYLDRALHQIAELRLEQANTPTP